MAAAHAAVTGSHLGRNEGSKLTEATSCYTGSVKCAAAGRGGGGRAAGPLLYGGLLRLGVWVQILMYRVQRKKTSRRRRDEISGAKDCRKC